MIARRLHAEGARVVLSGRRESALAALSGELGGAPYVVADLARHGEVVRLADEAGEVDLLVANAGLPANGDLVDLSVDDVVRDVDINVRATLVLVRLLLPGMLARGSGHVVVIGSLAGLAPTPRSSVYNAGKFALRGFAHALREEIRGSGVGVSLVSPTFVSGVGMWADTGQRAAHPEVSPERVAETCVRAVRRDRAEILVAPLLQRWGARASTLAPGPMQLLLRSSVVPPEAVEAQKSKK